MNFMRMPMKNYNPFSTNHFIMLSSLFLISSCWLSYLLIFFCATRFPSAINNILSVFAATFASCVTSMMVVPSLLISARIDIMSADDLESNAPVGSSPKMISGSFINALQLAARALSDRIICKLFNSCHFHQFFCFLIHRIFIRIF